jgi:radical SAM superfamily enzyme YgiQ (UPF0313 family)
MDFIIDNGGKASFSSMYIDKIDENFIGRLKKLGQKTVTFGMESVNEELRISIGKNFTNNDVIEKIRMISDFSIRNVKFYIILGMVGSQSIMDESLELVDFILSLCKIFKNMNFTVSLNPFVPKPGTAWSRSSMADSDYKKCVKFVNKKLSKFVKISSFSYREATLCTYINRLKEPSQILIDELKDESEINLGKVTKSLKEISEKGVLGKIDYEPGTIIKLV